MRPRIGITSGSTGVPVAEGVLPSHYLGLGYPQAVWAAGGVPVILPAVAGYEASVAAALMDHIDGLVLAGGTDIHPAEYGHALQPGRTNDPDPSRDRFEADLFNLAKDRQ